MRTIHAIAVLVALTACAAPAPVGRPFTATLQSGERFTGTLAEPAGGARAFSMTSDRGPTCTGQVRRAAGGGQGTFTCSDGRSGSFPVASAGARGQTTGTLGGQVLTVAL
jgi:hypothetical protein